MDSCTHTQLEEVGPEIEVHVTREQCAHKLISSCVHQASGSSHLPTGVSTCKSPDLDCEFHAPGTGAGKAPEDPGASRGAPG